MCYIVCFSRHNNPLFNIFKGTQLIETIQFCSSSAVWLCFATWPKYLVSTTFLCCFVIHNVMFYFLHYYFINFIEGLLTLSVMAQFVAHLPVVWEIGVSFPVSWFFQSLCLEQVLTRKLLFIKYINICCVFWGIQLLFIICTFNMLLKVCFKILVYFCPLMLKNLLHCCCCLMCIKGERK